MTMKFYLIIGITILLSSCLKHSIPDAMLGKSGRQSKIAATMSYEINGEMVTISVDDADNQGPGLHTLECVKSGGYVLTGLNSTGEFIFNFYSDSLKVGNYKYTSSYGPMYVTDFQGHPQYVYGPSDNMNFNVTTYKDGHISGNFSGQLTPMIMAGYPNNSYGIPGSVLITNGSFNNVPIVY
jgi:hypothetical protein